MRIAILGVGAMGCLFGARLTPHVAVTLIGSWPEQLAALEREPLRVIAPDGSEERVRLRATGDPATVGPVDVALVLTKAPKTEAAARVAARILAPDGLAVTLQNGLGHLEALAAHVGADRASLGVTTLGAATDGPGVLRLGGTGPTTLAEHPAAPERVAALAALLQRVGLECTIAADVRGLVWGKLAINAAINPLTALLGVPNGALLESEHARTVMAAAAAEVAAVAAAQGIALPFPDAAQAAAEVAARTAPNRSSMWQDVARGVPTEIKAITGAVLRAGDAAGVPTPVNGVLYRLVRALEALREESPGPEGPGDLPEAPSMGL
jgi:2-dehydropantoate 2-reductase